MRSISRSKQAFKFTAALFALGQSSVFAQNLSNPLEKSYSVSADFLYWLASEEVSNIWADIVHVGSNTSSWTAPSFDMNWSYGFRFGLDRKFGSQGWDSSLSWTWYQANTSKTIIGKSGDDIDAEFFAAFLGNDASQASTIHKMKGHWRILYNMIDLDLGKKFQVSRSLGLRPFIGLKGGAIHQPITVNYADITQKSTNTHFSAKEHLKNNFFAIGLRGGIDTTWTLCYFKNHSFSIEGDFALATMWGKWHCSDFYKNSLGISYDVSMPKSYLGSLEFEGFLGLMWQAYFDNQNYRFSSKLGYEMQLWVNQLRLATFQLQRLHGDLTLQGLTFNCILEF